jgi:DNA-binding response OmpR family regulator
LRPIHSRGYGGEENHQVRRLLVVGDDEATRRLFRVNLSDDYEIIDTADSEEALALAMEHKPDAILLDMHMPKLSGLDLCSTLQSFSQTHLVPILVVSGAVEDGAKAACAALGASAFFTKPLDFDVLKARLATMKRQTMVPRSEVRVRLRVPLKLHGSNGDGKEFDEGATTENVSLSGFMCTCGTALQKDSVVDVFLSHNGRRQHVGRARCLRSDAREGEAPQYAFRFIEKTEDWILK